jgi:MurNAc alpha-1-phosphate uridylyltransferase
VIAAVVIAAGRGTRLRPLTDHYAKPVLPIDGRPVLASLLRELGEAGCAAVTVVTGHLGSQVEQLGGDGRSFGLELRYARQPSPDGSTDAVLAAAVRPPYLVLGADTLFGEGAVGRFAAAWTASGAAGALAVTPQPGGVGIRDGLVEQVLGAAGVAGAPLWAVGERLAPYVEARPGNAPWELATAFQQAVDAGERVAAIEIAPTRGLTTPADLVRENFPYLRHL